MKPAVKRLAYCASHADHIKVMIIGLGSVGGEIH